MSAAALLRLALPSPTRSNRRLADPSTGRPLRAAAVADVDLDTGQAQLRPSPSAGPTTPDPEGVHALVWFHGRPLGEVVTLGPPAEVLPGLAERCEQVLRPALVHHLLDDAVALPQGLRRARAGGLRGLPHPPGPDAPPVSVTLAVCTRDRPDSLAACLRSIADLSDPVHEVLVVDNGSTDGRTEAVARSFAFVRYVHEPRRGLDWARNRALLEATGEVVAFTDDDVQVDPSWVGALARCFADEPAAAAITGLVVPLELATPEQVVFETVGGFGRGWRRRWFSAALDHGEPAGTQLGGAGAAGTGANMAFRREALLSLGGFDTALDVGTRTGGGGDLEAFYRIVAAGHLLVYEPAAVVRHGHRATRAELTRQMRGNGSGLLSYLLGAGRGYPPVERRELRRVARWWLVHWAGRRLVAGVVAPDVVPADLHAAELAGAADAVVRRLYRQARRQARQQLQRHGGRVLHIPYPSGVRVGGRAPDPVVAVDLHEDAACWTERLQVTHGSRRTRVRVSRGGVLQHVYTLDNHGAQVSPARLRRSLVDALGPALLAPGLAWDGPDGQVLPARERGHRLLAVGVRERSPRQERLLAHVLDEGIATEPDRVPPDLSVSILICTRDRPEHLERSMTAIAAQAAGTRAQIVVVDNSDDPTRTAEIAGRFGAEALHEPRPGLSRARNAASGALRGDVVVYVDDDVLVPDGWLPALLAPFADPRVGAVAGNVLPADVATLAPQVFEDYGGLGRGPYRTVFTPAWLRAGRGPAATWRIGATANAAVRGEALRQLGPWLESLGPGNPAGVGEDIEYFYRLLQAGWRIVYQPNAVVQHYHRPDLGSLAVQLRSYSAGHVAYHLELAARHGDLRGLRRVCVSLPVYLARRLQASRHGDDYPLALLRAEALGWVSGPAAWWVSRRAAA